jgi:D-alanyl-D-alanine carboxypeptidase/D-alanyl-D-alanine-endopeptidase (penicillin-binding protein 4)
MSQATDKRGTRRAWLAALACAIPILSAPAAHASAPPWGPDVPGRTPVARSASARAQTAVSAQKLQSGIARYLRRSGGSAGVWVGDPETGATVFSSGGSKPRILASNMKLFTTSTALSQLGPDHQFETALVAVGTFTGGVVQGNLVLVGGGDPSLTGQGVAKLVAEARAAGLDRVTGKLLYDESIFDRRHAIPQTGIGGGRFSELGRLSGLSFESGRSKDPARAAALTAIGLLRKRGVSVAKKTGRTTVPESSTASVPVADVTSSPLSQIARSTNVFSINFYAEMLLKDIAAASDGQGTTTGGVAQVTSFASAAGASLRTENGSGLSRLDRASPRSVVALLDHMLDEDAPVRDAWLGSLAVAGRSGTLADRMRGTAAQDACRGKTGTITGISALSGYCDTGGGRLIAFSILMSKVNIDRAHVAQDGIAALVARYSG